MTDKQRIELLEIKVKSLEDVLQAIYKRITACENNADLLVKIASLINEEVKQ